MGELADRDTLNRTFVARHIETVVHFAASRYVGGSVTAPAAYYTNNVLNSLALVGPVRPHGVGQFLFSHACAVSESGSPEHLPRAEDHPRDPINP